MPIRTSATFHPVDQATFSEIAYEVVGYAHDIHNARGYYFDEIVYQLDLVDRLLQSPQRTTVETEVKVDVNWKTFSKPYFIDLMVDGCAIFELKSCQRLGPTHETQLTNYLFLTGLQHGLLLNFGAPKVQHRFINAKLTQDRRKDFLVDDQDWIPSSSCCQSFRQAFKEILADWGTGLEIALYQEAMVHFLGGEATVVKSIPVFSLSQPKQSIAQHRAHLLDSQTAFKITALRDIQLFEKNAIKWLRKTPLKFLQWVNITPFEVSFSTLRR